MTINDIVTELSKLDLSTYPYYQIRELICNIEKIGVLVYKVKKGTYITRARSGSGFENKADLSYKPQSLNKTFQRASTPNQTMFYGTLIHDKQDFIDSRGLAISECSQLFRGGKESSGIEKITFGRWVSIKDFELISIIPLIEFINIDNNPLLVELRNIYNRFTENDKFDQDNYLKIINFFSKEFCKTKIKGDFDYMISAVFSEVVTRNLGYDGVLYPSVQMGGQLGFNFSLKPESVDKCLELDIIVESSYYKNRDHGICIDENAFQWNTFMNRFTPRRLKTVPYNIIAEKIKLENLDILKKIN